MSVALRAPGSARMGCACAPLGSPRGEVSEEAGGQLPQPGGELRRQLPVVVVLVADDAEEVPQGGGVVPPVLACTVGGGGWGVGVGGWGWGG